jgi:L-lactate dehydrogenase
MVARKHAAGNEFEHPWLLDAKGQPSTKPAVMFGDPPGTILPLGGLDAGHKGFGLALLVEALTGGLAGFGRADEKEGWGATVFVQALDPAAFGGLDDFVRQTEHIAQQCRDNPPRDPGAPVRLPGERALARRREQLATGVELHPSIMPLLQPWASRLAVDLPALA